LILNAIDIWHQPCLLYIEALILPFIGARYRERQSYAEVLMDMDLCVITQGDVLPSKHNQNTTKKEVTQNAKKLDFFQDGI
jgi:hypothetical protein